MSSVVAAARAARARRGSEESAGSAAMECGATQPDLAHAHALQSQALKVSRMLKALANPVRLRILCQLAEGEKSVGMLERAIKLSQSALSQHLAVLRREQVVATRREGHHVIYFIASAEAAAVMRTLYDVFCGAQAAQPPGDGNGRRSAAGAQRASVGRPGQRRRQAA
jgi:ArsR family transcriptional regulator, virulence genes transcriptional regulator